VTKRDIANDRAMLSEGWCPICGSKFETNKWYADDIPRCKMAYTVEQVRAEIEYCAKLGSPRLCADPAPPDAPGRG
jgi:hypothetical protein